LRSKLKLNELRECVTVDRSAGIGAPQELLRHL